MIHSYTIHGMTCNSCVVRIKNALLTNKNILAADIQLDSPQATITMREHVGISELKSLVSKAGNFELVGHDHKTISMDEPVETKDSYYPIFLIFGFILGVTLLTQIFKGRFLVEEWMAHFMAGFFLVFSFFKLLNIRGFAEGYRTYDVVAKRIPAWGFIYPFVELGLAVLFLSGQIVVVTNSLTIVVMLVSSIGVIQHLIKRSPFQCACLGTVIRLPLSKVTLFEDLLMAGMSATMLIL